MNPITWLRWKLLKFSIFMARKSGAIKEGVWSEAEDKLIIEYRNIAQDKEIAKMLGRTIPAIRMRRSRLLKATPENENGNSL